MQPFEIIIIIVAILFVALVIFLSIFLKRKGKSLTSDCSGNCSSCGGKCKINLINDYKNANKEYRYTLYIEGMKCGMCETHLNDLIRNKFETAKKVKSNYRNGTLSFVSDGFISIQDVIKEIENIGYGVIGVVKK